MDGMLFDLEHGSFVDGPGIRTTVFFKGCNLNCAWCHNPEGQCREPQLMVYGDLCIHCGRCEAVCPHHLETCTLCGSCTRLCPRNARVLTGRRWSAEELWAEIEADRPFLEHSGGGVTFSGGDCMLQPDFLETMLRLCRENGIHTAVDTAGHVPWETFQRVMPFTDLFLYDVKAFSPELHRKWTGTDNRRILENLSRLLPRAAVWVRIPVIPGVNDSREEMLRIRQFLWEHGRPERVELLPYHAMGENKFRALGREVPAFSVPPAEQMEELRAIFA